MPPPNSLFKYLFFDFIGPYNVKLCNVTTKVYLLCFSCLWSRAINLIVCRDLSVKTFLCAFQRHCYSFGTPEFCVSDIGSQFVPGTNIIQNFLNDVETRKIFQENNVKPLRFEQFPKGCKELGSPVESSVKLVKKLLNSSISRLILDYFEFDQIVAEIVSILNKRPVAFKEALRDNSVNEEIPHAITPEILLHGHELLSLNLVPGLQPQEQDSSFSPASAEQNIVLNHGKLSEARARLIQLYNEEFRGVLVQQATNLPNRYKPQKHEQVDVGDIVLIKEPLLKSLNYPMAIIREIVKNSLGETTEVKLMKGGSREILRRHATSLVPFLKNVEGSASKNLPDAAAVNRNVEPQNLVKPQKRLRRRAAKLAAQRNKKLAHEGMT